MMILKMNRKILLRIFFEFALDLGQELVLDQPGGDGDAADEALRAGVAVAFDDDPVDAAENGSWILGVMEPLAQANKNFFDVRGAFLDERAVELVHDDSSDPFSCFQENISSKAIGDEDIDLPIEDISAFDVS